MRSLERYIDSAISAHQAPGIAFFDPSARPEPTRSFEGWDPGRDRLVKRYHQNLP